MIVCLFVYADNEKTSITLRKKYSVQYLEIARCIQATVNAINIAIWTIVLTLFDVWQGYISKFDVVNIR